MSERDRQIDSLIRALGSKRTRGQAWSDFLKDYSPVIFQVVRHYEPDDDRAGDCYLFVCEQLSSNDYRRLRRFEPEGPAKFTTWFRVVTRHLYLDWRRRQAGRHRMFQAVTRMPDLEQAVFDCLYQKGLSFEETLARLQIDSFEVTKQGLSAVVSNLNRALTSRHFWLLSTRTPRVMSLEGREAYDGTVVAIPVSTDDPSPEELTEKRELLNHLHKGFASLEAPERLLIRLRYEKELSLDQIGRLTGLNNRQQVDRQIKKAIAKLRGSLPDISTEEKAQDNGEPGP